MKKILILLGALLFCYSSGVLAKRKMPRTLPSGVVFPMFNQAAFINPATLPLASKARSIQLLYQPPETSDGRHFYQASFANNGKRFGLGLGYDGSTTKYADSLRHGGFVGAGYAFDMVAIGVGVREPNTEDSVDPFLDIAFNIGENAKGNGLNGSVILRDLNHDARMDIGIGYMKRNKYQLEANVLFPDFDDLTSNYTIAISAGVYAGIFGVSFGSQYHVGPETYSHFLAGSIQLGESLSVLVKFETPNQFTFGLTLSV